MEEIKNIPNAVTMSRIFLSFTLLFFEPVSIIFFIIYVICGITDVLDGYLARKKNVASRLGAKLDSIADLVFICIMLLIFLPILDIPIWAIVWIVAISIVRFSSLVIVFIKYKSFAFLHTYANKATGMLLFCFPLLYAIFGTVITCCILCGVASISAIEELAINIRSKELSRDIKFIFER